MQACDANPQKDDGMTLLDRRQFLIVASAVPFGLACPAAALAAAPSVKEEMLRLFGDKIATPGKIRLDVPAIAENGFVVPLNVDVDSAMTQADHVTVIHIFADGNPNPMIGSFFFTPLSGRAAMQTRMRLAQSQSIIAIAEMSDGALFSAQVEIKVTLGGCGG